MTFLELVKTRSSCRRYLKKSIPREVIERCIEAARFAPSACNSQPWHFIIVDDQVLKDTLSKGAFSGTYSMNSFAKEAPVIAVVVREKSKYAARLAGHCRGTKFSLIDLGIACEHFILQAQEEGLGTCWLGWFNERWVKKTLNIPRNKKVDVIISMGYPQNKTWSPKEREPRDKISEFR